MGGQEKMDTYDLVVIGAGPAGQAAAELAAHAGRRAIIVEHNRPGGVVTTTGGAPTKTLRDAALYLTGYGQAEVYGVRPAIPLEVALPIVVARTQQVRDRLQTIVAQRLAALGIDYLQGAARLRSSGSVLVTLPDGSNRELRGQSILVATGSRPAHPPGIPFDDPDVFDTDRVYTLDRVPRQAVIVGGGPVGVEFATVLAALGVPVTLVSQAERLLPSMDAELAELMGQELSRRGVRLVLGAGARSVGRVDGRLMVTLSNDSALESDAVLFATGRQPNSDGLGLDSVGVQLDERGRIVVDHYFRTTAPGVYAAGDVIRPALASTAAQQGRTAARHACGLLFGLPVDQAASSAVYGMPELAGVGLTEEQVRRAEIPYVVGRCDLAETVRGAIAGRGGRLKLIFREDDRKLLGVHCLGDIASETVGLGHAVIAMGGTIELLLALALNAPTYSAAYHDAAIDGLSRLAEALGQRAPGQQLRAGLALAG
jgi:NAD(P) transhydrogenase